MLLCLSLPANAAEWQSFPLYKNGAGIFEPSGIRQLPGGGFLVVQDEPSAALTRFILTPETQAGGLEQVPPSGVLPNALNDLEGLAEAPDGTFFAITSFSRDRDGKKRKSRQRLLRLRLTGQQMTGFDIYQDLLDDILAAYPQLKGSVKSKNAKGREGFNIEGLCFDKEGKRLFIGLRGPVLGGDSLILVLENPNQLFEGGKPQFASEMIRLDLDKGGLRAMSFIPALNRYLLVAQKANRKTASNREFRLWEWGGPTDPTPKEIRLPGLSLRNAEGIAQIRHMDNIYVMMVSDDGDRRKGKAGHYLLVPVETIARALPAN